MVVAKAITASPSRFRDLMNEVAKRKENKKKTMDDASQSEV